MKHSILLIATILAGSFSQLSGAEESLPTIESTTKWITVRSEFLLNGRKVPFSMSIRKDTIVSVYEEVLERQRTETEQSVTPDDRAKIPVEIVINTKETMDRFRIKGLTSATAPAVLKMIMAAVDTKEIEAETQNEN